MGRIPTVGTLDFPSINMSTTPKVKLITQPMDVIYIALSEGNATRLLPKITSFPYRILMFLNFFLDFFRYFEKLEKK